MSRPRIEDDPVFRQLLREQEIALKRYRRCIVELRRLYATNVKPEAMQAAMLQQETHDAEHRVRDATDAVSKYGWEIVPFSNDPHHLEKILRLREEGNKRLENIKTSHTTGPVTIITRINGVERRIKE